MSSIGVVAAPQSGSVHASVMVLCASAVAPAVKQTASRASGTYGSAGWPVADPTLGGVAIVVARAAGYMRSCKIDSITTAPTNVGVSDPHWLQRVLLRKMVVVVVSRCAAGGMPSVKSRQHPSERIRSVLAVVSAAVRSIPPHVVWALPPSR